MDFKTHLPQGPAWFKQLYNSSWLVKALAVVLLFILFLALHSCLSHYRLKPTATPILIRTQEGLLVPEHSPLRKQLQITTTQLVTKPHQVRLPAIIEGKPDANMNILAPVNGHVLKIMTSLGTVVTEGQVLATLQSAAYAQAFTDQLKAKSALQQIQEAWTRAQKVNRAGANSIKEIEIIKNNYTQAQAELLRATTVLAALGTESTELQIKAPQAGKIIAVNVSEGAFINDNTLPLFQISNTQSLWVTVCIPEYLIPIIQPQQQVRIKTAAYTKPWQGKIDFINAIIDPDTRCNRARINLTNPDGRLQPNMFATVTISIPQEPQILLPLSAVLLNNDATTVFVETAPWTFKRRVITLGAEDGDFTRVIAGILPGERVVTAGGILVND